MKKLADRISVAVFGTSPEAVLYAYYLQRFGVNVDLYYPTASALLLDSDHLTASWLCFKKTPAGIERSLQGLAELKDLILDLGFGIASLETGTVIFENREAYVSALKDYSEQCRSRGLLVEYSEDITQMGVPLGTIASMRIVQDLAVSPKVLIQKVKETFIRRGGSIYFGQYEDSLVTRSSLFEMPFGNESRYYDRVILEAEKASDSPRFGCAPSDCPFSSFGIYGRFISFERASHILFSQQAETDASMQAPSTHQCIRSKPCRSLIAADEELNVYVVAAPHDLTDWFATAREVALFFRGIADRAVPSFC